jgi:deoxyribose-phosphate aldolase
MKPLNEYIDHTNIDRKAKKEDIMKSINEAKKYHFRGICLRSQWVKLAVKELKGTGVKVTLIVDDPIGDSPFEEKLAICKKAKADGSDEQDVVINVPDVKHERWGKIEKELKQICKILPTKLIIGSGYLTDDEIAKASQLVKKAGAICVKTATDKDPLEHRELKEKAYHLKIMRDNAPGLLVKAAGKIICVKDAKMMIKAGADILGTSNGARLMQELEKKHA